MPNLMDPNIVQLLQLFQPTFFFDPTEQLFPCVAEEFLVQQSPESWTAIETHQRGTAVLTTPLTADSYDSSNVVAGSDAPSGGALTLNATAPNGIGQTFPYNADTQDMFLDCGGWDDTAAEVEPGGTAYSTGSVEYLQALFSALGNAMNSAIPVSTPNPPANFSIARSNNPTVYAEIDWAGRYPIIDRQRVETIGGQPDFPSQIGGPQNNMQPEPLAALNDYLALTYYLFYPAMETSPIAPPNPDVNRIREGQWEAVTVFLKGTPDFRVVDKQGRPDFPFTFTYVEGSAGVSGLTPAFLAYSSGYSLGDDNFNPLAATVQQWPGDDPSTAQIWLGTHPIVYVTSGTHRNLFTIDATVTPGTSSGPNTALNTTGAAIMSAAGTAIGVCASIAELPPAAVACLVISAIIAIIGFLLFLLSFLLESSSPQTESPQSTQPGSDVARDDGPTATPTAPGSPPTPGVPQTTLRTISEYTFDPTPPITTYPVPPAGAIEMPSWWWFPGRWGVRITPLAAGTWDSGSRRTDPYGRTRAYWNTYQLVSFIAASAGAISL
jgi:hypothetical protein